METIVDENTCRICLRKQNTMYSLFRKRKGIFPCEKLDKIGVKSSINDTAPSNICCECLAELDITVSFLEKCEKANQILSEQLTRGLAIPEDVVTFKGNGSIENKNNAYYNKNNDVEVDQEVNVDSSALEDEVKSSDVALSIEEPQCAECGSKRRCRHWTPPATHTCPYCQKVFSRKFNFKLHLKRHSGEREWSCVVCGARAVSRWLAARHCEPRRRRPCPVPGCGKTYTTNTNLNTHLRMHTGERPFECSNCGKKFTSKNTLNDHMRIHTGALPYICPVCGKRFRTNKLSAHMPRSTRPPRPRARRRTRARAAPPGTTTDSRSTSTSGSSTTRNRCLRRLRRMTLPKKLNVIFNISLFSSLNNSYNFYRVT